MSSFPAVPQPIQAPTSHVKQVASYLTLSQTKLMQTVNIHAAKTQLSRLIEAVEAGEEVIIARAGKPVARLVPMIEAPKPKRQLGLLNGRFNLEDFDEPLPDDLLDMFEGR